MADQLAFEGLEVSEVHAELTGGGTHGTRTDVHLGDEGTALVRWRCVAVKHPLKAGAVNRVQTLNVMSVENIKVTQTYEPEAADGDDTPQLHATG
jgi:hypothetical protein